MSKTLVLNSKKAIPEVQRWLNKKAEGMTYHDDMMVEIGEEMIIVLNKEKLSEIFIIDKLVLMGEFTESDLTMINKCVIFKE